MADTLFAEIDVTAKPKKTNYRPDIDGLRAVAVVSVLLFHADIGFFSGGYVGVDVFFVISGYLITKIIRDDVLAGTFSYGDFYIRRARRLFPALFVTIAITFLVGAYLLIPYHLERLGAATVSSLFWFSNVLFWTESGYFDADALYKPLLHTWSLSVEEQFYLFWPALVVFLAKLRGSKNLFGGILLVSMFSLLATEWMRTQDSYSAFFLTPFRVYEFGIGALTLWLVERVKLRNPLMEGLCAVGLLLIALSVVFFDKRAAVPGFAGLVPCVGSALVLYAGQARITGLLMSNRLAVYIGRISYSLYLVHWPVVVFYRYREESFGALDQLLVVSVSLVLAILLHHGVENPLRRARQAAGVPKKFLWGAALSTVLIAAPAAHAWSSSGWSWRWDVPAPILKAVGEFSALRDESWELVRDSTGVNSATFDDQPSKVLLIGDSHSKDLFNALYHSLSTEDDVSLRRVPLSVWCVWMAVDASAPDGAGALIRRRCRRQSEQIFSSPLLSDADHIVLSLRWSEASINHLPALLERLSLTHGANITIAGRTAEFPNIPLLALTYGQVEGFDQYAGRLRNKELDALNKEIMAIARSKGATFINKAAAVCSLQGDSCAMFDESGEMLIFDEGHWTVSGAKYFGRAMRRSGQFERFGLGATP